LRWTGDSTCIGAAVIVVRSLSLQCAIFFNW
jgi:hypothetical protein